MSDEAREERLKRELRANLRRRKARARAQAQEQERERTEEAASETELPHHDG